MRFIHNTFKATIFTFQLLYCNTLSADCSTLCQQYITLTRHKSQISFICSCGQQFHTGQTNQMATRERRDLTSSSPSSSPSPSSPSLPQSEGELPGGGAGVVVVGRRRPVVRRPAAGGRRREERNSLISHHDDDTTAARRQKRTPFP